MNKDKVKEILEAIKKESFVKGYEATDEEAMGLLVSKYFKWSPLEIAKVAYNSFEDANMHGENEEIEKMIERLEK